MSIPGFVKINLPKELFEYSHQKPKENKQTNGPILPCFKKKLKKKKIEYKYEYAVPTIDHIKKIDSVKKPLPFENEFFEQLEYQPFLHQIEVLRWMYWIEKESIGLKQHTGGVLGDDMGMGKTYASLLNIAYFKKYENVTQPTLLIAPISVLQVWIDEAESKLGIQNSDIFVYRGPLREKNLLYMKENDSLPLIIITTYETLQKDFQKDYETPIFKIHFRRIICDEAHLTRNAKCKTAKAIGKFDTSCMFCLTGTPIFNSTMDIETLSLLCTPGYYLSRNSNYNEKTNWKNCFFLRRKNRHVDIPPYTKQDVWLEFNENQMKEYKSLYQNISNTNMENISEKKLEYRQLLVSILRLRQYCDHPDISKGNKFTVELLNRIKEQSKCSIDFYESDMEEQKDSSNDDIKDEDSGEEDMKIEDEQKDVEMKNNIDLDNYNVSSPKLDWLMTFLFEAISKNEKSVVMSQFTTMLDIIEYYLIKNNISYLRFDGKQQKTESRKKIIKEFQTKNEISVLLTTLKAGGVGLNFVPAVNLILFDPWWNRSQEIQAEKRIHRPPQKKQIKVIRLLIKNSIEENVLEIQEQKNDNELDFYKNKNTLNLKEMKYIIERLK